MNSIWAKGLLGCGSAAGLGCAIGIPLYSKYLNNQNDQSVRVANHFSDLSQASGNGMNTVSESTTLTFEELGSELSQKLSSGGTASAPPGKEELSRILNSNSKGVVKDSKFKTCRSGQVGTISYCGYLEFYDANNLNSRYKLKITYETKSLPEEKDIWKVIALGESSNKTVSYWNVSSTLYDQALGETIANVSFDKFSSFENISSIDEGQEIEGYSIKKEV